MVAGIVSLAVVAAIAITLIFMIGANMTKDAINQSLGYDDYNRM